MFSLDDVKSAADLIYQHMAPTPCLSWPLLSAEVGGEVWVKHENLTPTGAFKVRGGLVYMHELARSGERRGLITATRGNHGQSIPFAARGTGHEVTVLVPHGNSVEKNAAMRGWGASLIEFGDDFDAARVEAERRAREQDLLFVPSFAEPLVRGVASYALEMFSTAPRLNKVYVPIGMGSGACAVVQVRDLLGLDTEVIGVVSSHADAFARSLAAGKVETTESASTFADGMACRVPNPDALALLRAGLARVVRVTDDDVAQAMRLLFRTTHNVAEGAGAAATAALLAERDWARGERSAVIITGGNVDQAWFSQVLAGQTPTV